MEPSTIIRVTSRRLIPFILVYGFYLITYGHLSPGGGFQGGVVLGSAVILLCLSLGTKKARGDFKAEMLTTLKNIGISSFILLGFAGIGAGYSFFTDFLPHGRVGELPSAGFILFLNLVVGIKVGAGIALIFYAFTRSRDKEDFEDRGDTD